MTNKKTVGKVMAVMLLFVLSLFFIGGTYARYSTQFTGTASVTVAKWDVNLKDKGEEVTTMEDLTFTVKDNTDVVAGKIAPGVTAEGSVEIDFDGTEVSVEVYVDATDEALQTAVQKFGMNSSDITFTVKEAVGGEIETSGNGTKSSPLVIKLPDTSAGFTTENGKVTITMTLKWENTEAHNAEDTTAGKKAETDATFQVPVTLHVQQHIGV